MSTIDQARQLIALLGNKDLAHNLIRSTDPSHDLGPVHQQLRDEARARVGEAASTKEDADFVAFQKRHHIGPETTQAALEELFDALADHEVIPGGVYYLAAELLGVNAWDLRNHYDQARALGTIR